MFIDPSRQPRRRTFLFLQGLSTPLFQRLGKRLEERGNEVRRVNICAGDMLFWPRPGAVHYRGRFADWSAFLTAYIANQNITDIVLFGDSRPYHQVAIILALRSGIAVHALDEGYLRPDWITLVMGARPVLEDELVMLPALAAHLPSLADHQRVGGGFAKRAVWEVAFQATTLAFAPLFPHYQRHRPIHPLIEGMGWVKRALTRGSARRAAEKEVGRLVGFQRKFHLLPLQLDSDYQIRRHSRFANMGEVMELVFASFAANADRDGALVVKLHPLDNGLVNRRRQTKTLARKYGIVDRIVLLDGGHLPTLLQASQGVVVVNSTAGLAALHYHKPTYVLADPVYNLPGLTSDGTLDSFWKNGLPPKRDLVLAFEQVLADRTQVNGSFFTSVGIELAINNLLSRLERTTALPKSGSVLVNHIIHVAEVNTSARISTS